MSLFKKSTCRRKNVPLPPRDEIIEIMCGKGLNFTDEVAEVIYCKDKTKRYVILKDGNCFTYCYEVLEFYDEEEYAYSGGLPACWRPSGGGGFYDGLDTAMKEIKSEADYKSYF